MDLSITDHTTAPTIPSGTELASCSPHARERVLPALVITHWPAWLTAFVASVGLFVHARSYMPFFVDDAYISLRYAQRFAEGQGLTWTDGPPVEGYTNLLWVVLVALPGVFGANLLDVARALGVMSSMLLIGAIVFDQRSLRWRHQGVGLIAGGLLAASGSLAAWSIGGLEQPLVLAALGWAFAQARAHVVIDGPIRAASVWSIGALLGVAALSRADGALWTLALTLGWLLARGLSRRVVIECARLVVLPIVCVVSQLGFRLVYYRDWVPNTFRVKVAPTMGRLTQGLQYLARAVEAHEVILVAAGLLTLVALVSPITRRRASLLLVCLVSWTTYITLVGGDFFPQRRLLLPSLVLLIWLIADGLRAITEVRASGPWLAAALGLFLLQHHARAQAHDPEREAALHDGWHRGGRPIGRFLEHHFGAQQPLLAVDAAGTLPYYSRLPCLDLLGLNDRYLTHHRPKDYGHGFIGHELGDADYVLRRKPDLIAFWGPHGSRTGRWKAGIDLLKRPEFFAQYQDVELRTPTGDRTVLWMRREGRVGIRRQPDRVVVPGYLMTQAGSFAHEDAGRLGLVVSSVRPAALQRVSLEAGTWRLGVEGIKVDALQCDVFTGNQRRPIERDATSRFELTRATEVRLNCRLPAGAWAHVAQINFVRERSATD